MNFITMVFQLIDARKFLLYASPEEDIESNKAKLERAEETLKKLYIK